MNKEKLKKALPWILAMLSAANVVAYIKRAIEENK